LKNYIRNQSLIPVEKFYDIFQTADPFSDSAFLHPCLFTGLRS